MFLAPLDSEFHEYIKEMARFQFHRVFSFKNTSPNTSKSSVGMDPIPAILHEREVFCFFLLAFSKYTRNYLSHCLNNVSMYVQGSSVVLSGLKPATKEMQDRESS